MRLGACILAELSVATALLGGGGLAATWGVERARAALSSGARSETPQLAARRDLPTLPNLRVGLESTGTFLGMSDELLLERIRTEPIVRFKLSHGGSSISFRVELADGSRVAWKPTQTNLQTMPRKEVAAYRLNRLLGLNAVPPAAPRAVSREELLAHLHPDSAGSLPRIQAEVVFGPSGRTFGAASYWIPVLKDSGFDTPAGRRLTEEWLSQGTQIPFERRDMAAQLSTMVVFDFLTANPDRYSGGNMKMSADGTKLFFMDNTMAFFVEPLGTQRNRAELAKTQRFSKSLYQALERIDLRTLERALADEPGSPYEILTRAEIRAVVARRDAVKAHIDQLIATHGRGKVLVFP